MAALLILLVSQVEPVKAEKVWRGADWKAPIGAPLIRTRAEWDGLWKGRGEPAPDVDFEKSVVLAIFCGGFGQALGLEEIASVPGGSVVVYSNPANGVVTGKPFRFTAYLIVQLPKRAEKIELKVRWTESAGSPWEQVRTDADPRLDARGK